MHISFQSLYRADLFFSVLWVIVSVPATISRTIITPKSHLAALGSRDSNFTNGTDAGLLDLTDLPTLTPSSDAESVQLSGDSPSGSGRQLKEKQIWDFSYSRNSIKSLEDGTLFALSAEAADIHVALQNAVEAANSTEYANIITDGQIFETRKNGLSVVLSCYNKTEFTLGTWVYTTATQAVISAINETTGNTSTVVGVIKDPAGTPFADYAVIYAYIVYDSENPPTGGYFLNSTSQNETAVVPIGGNDRRLSKRKILTVPGSTLRLQIHKGAIQLTAWALQSIARNAYDSIKLERDPPISGYSGFVQNELVEFLGENALFSLQTLGFNRIRREDLMKLLYTLSQAAQAYVENIKASRFQEISNLQGQILDEAGTTIANWAVGKVLQSAPEGICPVLLVEHPAGSYSLGCWTA